MYGWMDAGPMFQEYNNTLRSLGNTTFREASVEVKTASKDTDQNLVSRTFEGVAVTITVDRVSV